MARSLSSLTHFGLLSGLLVIGLGCDREAAWPAVKKLIRGEFPEVEQISVETLHSWLEAADRPAPILLDVREEAEFHVSHLRGAIQVDPGAAPRLPAEVPKDAAIVAYCSVGYRSSAFVQSLREQGYTAAVNLEGSIFEWANRGYPVVRDGRTVRQVHPYDDKWGDLLAPELWAYPAD